MVSRLFQTSCFFNLNEWTGNVNLAGQIFIGDSKQIKLSTELYERFSYVKKHTVWHLNTITTLFLLHACGPLFFRREVRARYNTFQTGRSTWELLRVTWSYRVVLKKRSLGFSDVTNHVTL